MDPTQLHEERTALRSETVDFHRAVSSLMEELEAVDWYQQRIDASEDPELRAILAHNRDEETEHACMLIEWLRRRDERFDAQLRRFLFSDGPIVADRVGEAETTAPAPSLEIGSLRRKVSA